MRRGSIATTALLVGVGALGCASEPCTDTPQEVWIVTELSFGRAEGTTAPGFDLDGLIGMQCGGRDFTSPEGVRGIDNALAVLLPVVESQVGGLRLDGLVQQSIASGQILLAYELLGVDSHATDGCVSVRLRRLSGEPILGTDNLLLPGQTLYPDPTAVINELGPAAIVGGVLEPDRTDLAIPVSILDARFTLHMLDAQVRITFRDDDHLEGMLAGGIEVEEILAVVETLNIPSDLMATAEALTRANADLNPEAGGCTQISGVLMFRAVPGFVGE